MKKLLVLTAVSCLFPLVASAHPPSSITFKNTGEKIDVTAIHNVKDPGDHYIKLIKVTISDKNGITQNFIIQENATNQIASYVIPGLTKGAKIQVFAECNKMGSLKKDFTVK